MVGIQGKLSRVRKLELSRQPKKTCIEQYYGSFAAFEDECQVKMAKGKLDKFDFPVVLNCVRRWNEEEVLRNGR